METKSSSNVLLPCPPRWATPRNLDRPTIGGKIAEAAALFGQPFMPHQRYIADVSGEVDPLTGLLVYDEVVVHIMRQQGKTTYELAAEVQRCLGFKPAPQRVVYAAQSGVAAREKLLEEQWPLLKVSKLGKLVTPRRQSGHEALVFRNRSRISLQASTESAGHGPVVDLGAVDEAFAYRDSRVEQALVPAMQTRKNAQLLVCSTAGTEESTYLRTKVDAGRARCESGEPSVIAYFEWSFDPDEDPFSPDTWRRRMPALGRTSTERAVASAAERLPEREFFRAFGNLWVPRTALDPVIDPVLWSGLFDRQSVALDPIAMGIAVSRDRASAAIGIGGETIAGRLHVEVADYRPSTSWVVRRVLEMRDRWHPCAIAIDSHGAAGSLVAPLEAAGVELTFIGAAQATAGCGGFYDDALDGQLVHLDQAPLNDALIGARKRKLGGAWVWEPIDISVDIAPLEAVTLARYAFVAREAGGDEPFFAIT